MAAPWLTWPSLRYRGRGSRRRRRLRRGARGAAGPLSGPQVGADPGAALDRRAAARAARAGRASRPTRCARRSRQLLERRTAELEASELDRRLVEDRVDVTLPGDPPVPVGHLHLVSQIRRRDGGHLRGPRLLGRSRAPRSSTSTTTSPRSTTRPSTRRGCRRTPSTSPSTCCCARTPRRCRCARWSSRSRRSTSSCRVGSTGPTPPTPRTCRCSTSSRGWRSTRT